METLSYCREQACRPGSPNYYQTLYLSPKGQSLAWPVLAFQHELQDVITRIAEPSVARARLEWWQAELEHAAQGKAQHPIAQALQTHVLQHPGRLELLEEMLAGAVERLYHGHLESEHDYSLYVYRNHIAPWLILTDLDGEGTRTERDFAHAVGQALARMRILHMLGRDVAQGQILIPREYLTMHGLDHTDLMHPRTTDKVRVMLSELGEQALAGIHQAHTTLPPVKRSAQTMALIALAQAQALLTLMQADDWNLLEQRPELTPLRLLWISWRTARRARKGKL